MSTGDVGAGAGAAGQSSSIPCLSALLTPQCQGRSSPDPSGVGPVPGHSCCRQERGHRLVEEEVVLEGGRVRGLTRAARLVPGHPASLVPACHAPHCPRQGKLAAVPTYGQEPLPSWPERQKAAGAQPTPYQGLAGHWPCATRPPPPGHGQRHRARAGGGCEPLGLCSASSILPQLGRAEWHCEHPLHCRAASLGKGVLVPQGSRTGKGGYGLPERQCWGRGPLQAPRVTGLQLHQLTSMSCCCSFSVISLSR